MANWTMWRKLAEIHYWYDDEFDYKGPACYELALGGPRYGNIQPVYVGETANEKSRLTMYAQHGSHLSGIIDVHLRRGYTLYYRAVASRTKADAKRMQDNLLSKY